MKHVDIDYIESEYQRSVKEWEENRRLAIAIAAMQGILAYRDTVEHRQKKGGDYFDMEVVEIHQEIAIDAFKMADAMIAESKKGKL